MSAYHKARRGLRRLPRRLAAAVLEFLTGPLAADPARTSTPLAHELAGYRSARRGDYRILIRIDEDAHIVLAARIDHRADLYRPANTYGTNVLARRTASVGTFSCSFWRCTARHGTGGAIP